MGKSSIPLIEHIPHFLAYCKKKGYSIHTQENYKMYLQGFILWLNNTKKQHLKPHELTVDDIYSYKTHLSYFGGKKGHPLKMVTQNYYLIALRALLSYFVVKDVECIPSSKITLPRGFREEKTQKSLNLEQIRQLLQAPKVKYKPGLRDRAILGVLISSGFKINKLVGLNRNEVDNLPGEALAWVKEYLKTRQDENEALFINYKARKGSMGGRLTARSVERIVNKYGKKIGLPFLITPEILRWVHAHALSNEIIRIQRPSVHRTFEIENYRKKEFQATPFVKGAAIKSTPPTWNVVENIINNEVIWLKNNIPVLPEAYKENPTFLKYDDFILRKIAILIVSGKVKAVEFLAKNNKNLWDNLTEKQNLTKISYHGQEWHKKMMNTIYEYFKVLGDKVVSEPTLNYGRADLGVISNSNNKNIYIEVDTVSLFKLWYNLSTMKNTTFLVIPSEDRIIEFNT